MWFVCFLRHQHSPDFVMLTRLDNHIFELCLQNACMINVHMTCPLPPTQRNHKGWRSAPDAILPGRRWHSSGSRQGHPRHTGALTAWGGRGWPDTNATNGEVTNAMMHHPSTPKTPVLRQTNSRFSARSQTPSSSGSSKQSARTTKYWKQSVGAQNRLYFRTQHDCS